MSFFSRLNPKRAIDDFANEWRQPTPYRWQILSVAVIATFVILFGFLPDSERVEPRRPEVTYISTWASDRTHDEIIASNVANQARKDIRAAELAQRAEARKEAYRALGRATFVDVDAMEKRIEAERAAEEAADASASRSVAGATAVETGGQ